MIIFLKKLKNLVGFDANSKNLVQKGNKCRMDSSEVIMRNLGTIIIDFGIVLKNFRILHIVK